MHCFVFLEPTAEIKKGLINSAAVVGEEFSISLELSAACSGFWSLNGRLLRSGADYLITRSKTVHTLLIRAVTMEMNGAEIKFVGGGSQSSCTLSVKGMVSNFLLCFLCCQCFLFNFLQDQQIIASEQIFF